MNSDWSTGLVQYHAVDALEYASALACPCLWMQQIAFSISSSSPQQNQKNSCCNCWTPSLLSILIDIPVVFGCEICFHKANREWWILRHTYIEQNVDSMYDQYPYNPNNDTQWTPSNTSYDWWIFDWLLFYCNASLENTCADCCCGPKIHTANFPSAFACLVASVYPLFVFPLAFFLRQETKNKLHIRSENCFSSFLATLFCMPCSLVQMKRNLQHH